LTFSFSSSSSSHPFPPQNIPSPFIFTFFLHPTSSPLFASRQHNAAPPSDKTETELLALLIAP
jgi:hypothetical protein